MYEKYEQKGILYSLSLDKVITYKLILHLIYDSSSGDLISWRSRNKNFTAIRKKVEKRQTSGAGEATTKK